MQNTLESPCPVCPTPFNISNAHPCPLLTLGIPRNRRSTPWSHHVFCPTSYLISFLHPLLAHCLPHTLQYLYIMLTPRRGVTMCSALPPTSSLACTLYWPHCLPHTLQYLYNAYPIPAPSWGFHVADAARREATMCSALPPTSSLACTLYWPHCLPHSLQYL